MRGQKDLKSIGLKIKEIFDTKCLKYIKQYILVKNWTNFRSLYPGINVIEANRFFLQKEGPIRLCCGIKQGPNRIENPQNGVITAEPPYHVQVWEYPPRTYISDIQQVATPSCTVRLTHGVYFHCRSPTMAGGIFSIDKRFFFELGTYDSGLNIWGGENIELSFKVMLLIIIYHCLQQQ